MGDHWWTFQALVACPSFLLVISHLKVEKGLTWHLPTFCIHQQKFCSLSLTVTECHFWWSVVAMLVLVTSWVDSPLKYSEWFLMMLYHLNAEWAIPPIICNIQVSLVSKSIYLISSMFCFVFLSLAQRRQKRYLMPSHLLKKPTLHIPFRR